MVEIFKTNVRRKADTNYIITFLKSLFPDYKVNFDLEDCDKILRVEADKIDCINIVKSLNYMGFLCVEFE
jgi:hypothetical protein